MKTMSKAEASYNKVLYTNTYLEGTAWKTFRF